MDTSNALALVSSVFLVIVFILNIMTLVAYNQVRMSGKNIFAILTISAMLIVFVLVVIYTRKSTADKTENPAIADVCLL